MAFVFWPFSYLFLEKILTDLNIWKCAVSSDACSWCGYLPDVLAWWGGMRRRKSIAARRETGKEQSNGKKWWTSGTSVVWHWHRDGSYSLEGLPSSFMLVPQACNSGPASWFRLEAIPAPEQPDAGLWRERAPGTDASQLYFSQEGVWLLIPEGWGAQFLMLVLKICKIYLSIKLEYFFCSICQSCDL